MRVLAPACAVVRVVQMRLIREADKDKAKDDDGILKSMSQHLEVRGREGAATRSLLLRTARPGPSQLTTVMSQQAEA